MNLSRSASRPEVEPLTTIPRTSISGLPRLLKGVSPLGAMTLWDHVDAHGELPAVRRRDGRHAAALIDQIEQAGLGGRGGAGFPMAKKMRAVASGRGKPIVVINATEGEPASLKDRTLLETAPHTVLDGAAVAARAIGADEVILCVCESSSAALECSSRAIGERDQLSGRWPRIRLDAAPEGYVAGQESALVSHLNGGQAQPTFSPPMPFQRGVRNRPTLVNNAETLAHVALIARHGARWFRELGLSSQPGSTLVTLSGALLHPDVYEVEYGTSLTTLLDAAGGTSSRVRAVLFGGYAGAWVDGRALRDLSLSDMHLAPYKASLGAGVVLLLSENACPVAETARVTHWLAQQSSGQCGPCVHGLSALADTLGQVVGGVAENDTFTRIEELSTLIKGRGACGHPDGTLRFVRSAMDVFSEEFADHARHGACEACKRGSELPLPIRAMTAKAA